MDLFKNLKDYKILDLLDFTFIKNKRYDLKTPILIVGSPRSGTSWLMELLGNMPGGIFTYEPFNPKWFNKPQELGFYRRVYLPPENNWLELEKYFKSILTGNYVGFRYSYEFTPSYMIDLLFSNRVIIKSVRINRLLPWFVNRFDSCKIIYIIRHPCAVISSQLKTGYCGYHLNQSPYENAFPTNEQVFKEAQKIQGLDDNILEKIKNLDTIEELLAAVWCLDNYIPLSMKKPYHWELIFYEDLIRKGKSEISRIFKKIGLEKVPKSVFKHLKTPSAVAPKDELEVVKKVDAQLSKWKSSLSEKQIKNILRVVSDLNCDFYLENSEPNFDKIK